MSVLCSPAPVWDSDMKRHCFKLRKRLHSIIDATQRARWVEQHDCESAIYASDKPDWIATFPPVGVGLLTRLARRGPVCQWFEKSSSPS